MAITSPPSVTELPTAPERGDRTTFRSRAELFIAALPDFRDELSGLGDNVYANAVETYNNSISAAESAASADSAASSAEAARDLVYTAGNIQGDWSGLTGSISTGESVSHGGRLWVAITDIADVTASEPSESNSDWLAVTPAKYSDVSKSTGYTVVPADNLKVITCTASLTLSFDSASVLTPGWCCYVKNTGSGDVTLDPYGSETIDGVSSGKVEPGDVFFIRSDGSNLQCEKVYGYKPHYITASETWTCPAGINSIFVQLQAAGGGGSRTNSTTAGQGGSGGAYGEGVISVSAGESKTITIGAKGVKATADNTSGTNASASSFGSDITCPGGYGGVYNQYTTNPGPVSSGGDLNARGGAGSYPSSTLLAFGGNSHFGFGEIIYPSGTPVGVSEYGIGGCGTKTGIAATDGGPGLCIIWY